MVVIFIMGLLMAMTVGAVSGMRNSSAATTTKSTLAVLDASLDELKNATGEYPRIAGTPTTPLTVTELSWLNSAVTQMETLEQNKTMLSKLGRYKEVHDGTSPFGTPLTNFRNCTDRGVPLALDSAAGTISASDAESLRSGSGGTLTVLRDGWDRPIYYFPSDAASDVAATLRPLFVSAGRDGKLQSTPWKAGSWPAGAFVVYQGKCYTTTSGSSATPGTDSTWEAGTSDDFTTRGN